MLQEILFFTLALLWVEFLFSLGLFSVAILYLQNLVISLKQYLTGR